MPEASVSCPVSPSVYVDTLYSEKSDFILIGLTGRTGSGCSTVANILKKKSFEQLLLPPPIEAGFKSMEERKYRVIFNYAKLWEPFRVLSMSAVIASFILQGSYEQFEQLLQDQIIQLIEKEKLQRSLKRVFGNYEKAKIADKIDAFESQDSCSHTRDFSTWIDIYEKAEAFWGELRDCLVKFQCYTSASETAGEADAQKEGKKGNLYSYLFQLFGNNIRSSGSAFLSVGDAHAHMFDLACRTNYVIKAYRAEDRKANAQCQGNASGTRKYTHICIDAIRNPYEAVFFQDRYAAFYLVSVKTTEEERLRRLANLGKQEIADLDKTEYPPSLKGSQAFTRQDIKACIQLSDIHIENPHCDLEPTDNPYLTKQIVKYVVLMMHPGLITPTPLERCMQVAFNAKLNSGCLSRQVGAVITDADFSIKAIGWNDVAHGQVPCNLRDIRALCEYQDGSSHSKFELENADFRKFMAMEYAKIDYTLHLGRLYPYCFSEVYNNQLKTNGKGDKSEEDEKDSEESKQRIRYVKNQVYTRALHAEENAFLQITKYGGQGIKGGFLFVTASPCELCSKKAYQLGITRIYYIDPYPGIAQEQIIQFGSNTELNPEMHIFAGAIGKAYTILYSPKMPLKDELKSLLDK